MYCLNGEFDHGIWKTPLKRNDNKGRPDAFERGVEELLIFKNAEKTLS